MFPSPSIDDDTAWGKAVKISEAKLFFTIMYPKSKCRTECNIIGLLLPSSLSLFWLWSISFNIKSTNFNYDADLYHGHPKWLLQHYTRDLTDPKLVGQPQHRLCLIIRTILSKLKATKKEKRKHKKVSNTLALQYSFCSIF